MDIFEYLNRRARRKVIEKELKRLRKDSDFSGIWYWFTDQEKETVVKIQLENNKKIGMLEAELFKL